VGLPLPPPGKEPPFCLLPLLELLEEDLEVDVLDLSIVLPPGPLTLGRRSLSTSDRF
jgi:hypothetical protein